MSLTPICVPCKLEMRCVRNDLPVKDPATDTFPSTYWFGDEYECPSCHIHIITGFGKAIEAPPTIPPDSALAEALQFDYERPAEKGGEDAPAAVYCQECGKRAPRRRNPDGEYPKAGDECGREEGRRLPCPGILMTKEEAHAEARPDSN